MPDVSIVNSTITAAPKDYAVPGTQELLVKAVRASIDGTSAGSAFLPALQLLDPAGHVMWTAVDTTNGVAAGGTADVSWFPGVRRSGGGASSNAGLATLVAELKNPPTQTINAGVTAAINFDHIAVDTSGVFSNGGGSGTTWQLNTKGLYLVTLQVLPSPNWPTAAQGPIVFRPDVPIGTIVYSQVNSYTPGSINIGSFSAVVSTYTGVPVSWSASLNNQSSINLTLVNGGPGANGLALSMNYLGPEVLLP